MAVILVLLNQKETTEPLCTWKRRDIVQRDTLNIKMDKLLIRCKRGWTLIQAKSLFKITCRQFRFLQLSCQISLTTSFFRKLAGKSSLRGSLRPRPVHSAIASWEWSNPRCLAMWLVNTQTMKKREFMITRDISKVRRDKMILSRTSSSHSIRSRRYKSIHRMH